MPPDTDDTTNYEDAKGEPEKESPEVKWIRGIRESRTYSVLEEKESFDSESEKITSTQLPS